MIIETRSLSAPGFSCFERKQKDHLAAVSSKLLRLMLKPRFEASLAGTRMIGAFCQRVSIAPHIDWPARCARSRQSHPKNSIIMTELAEGRSHVGVRCSLAYWDQEFQRIHSPILRYGFSAASVAVALGVAFTLERFQFRDVELPVLTLAIGFATWYAGTGPSVLAVLLSSISFDYFFIEPRYSLGISVSALGARAYLPFIFVSGALGEEVAIGAVKIGGRERMHHPA